MTETSQLKVLTSPDEKEQIVIAKRGDGRFTYFKQFRAKRHDSWGSPGPDLGIYDCALTAETEARQCVEWLKERFH